jgi:hypothetical protein
MATEITQTFRQSQIRQTPPPFPRQCEDDPGEVKDVIACSHNKFPKPQGSVAIGPKVRWTAPPARYRSSHNFLQDLMSFAQDDLQSQCDGLAGGTASKPLDLSALFPGKGQPHAHFRAKVSGNKLKIRPAYKSCRKPRKPQGQNKPPTEEDPLSRARITARILESVLGWNDAVWNRNEWREMLGVDGAHWVRRILLLCRAQLTARKYPKAKDPKKLLMLPDGQPVGTRLLWPPFQPTDPNAPLKNPLSRLPEVILLVALEQIAAEDSDQKGGNPTPSGMARGAYATRSRKLRQWLLDHGATESWLQGHVNTDDQRLRPDAKDLENFRTKIRQKYPQLDRYCFGGGE